MKPYLKKLLVAGLLFAVFQYVSANSRTGSIVVEETMDSSGNYGECEEPFVTKLEDNYNDAFNQMLKFFESTNSALAKINERLDRMESDNVKIKTFIKSPVILEAFPKTLSRPSNGKSFGGSTFEQIQSALSSRSMAVEFVNYMETDLTGYQLSLDYGSVKKSVPTTVSSQTAQVATFEPDNVDDAAGTMVYRIGGTNSYLHVFFRVWKNYHRMFAVAFLSKDAPDRTTGINSCRDTESPDELIEKYQCEEDVPFDQTKSLLIHEGNVYAKVTFTPKETTSTLIIEVFKITF